MGNPPALPELRTERLLLRSFRAEDAPAVQRLAGAFEIADTTLLIPHPYPDGLAEKWISGHATALANGESLVFAVTEAATGQLCGSIGLMISKEHAKAEMGYWIGVPFWGKGYATEAGRALLEYGFGQWNLNRIFALHFCRNPASGRVLAKLGLRHEGRLRQHIKKGDGFEDVECWGLLRLDWTEGLKAGKLDS